MIEVEAKYKIKDAKRIKKKVSSIAKYIGKETKIDDYYTLLPLNKYPIKSLRIRKLDSKYQINFKKRIVYKEGIHAKNEFEFHISNIEKFKAMLSDLGFKKWLTKYKITYLYEIKRNFHIELNFVKQLGYFLEIEYLVNKKSEIKEAMDSIKLILAKLNVNKKDLVKDGYTKLLWIKKNNGPHHKDLPV